MHRALIGCVYGLGSLTALYLLLSSVVYDEQPTDVVSGEPRKLHTTSESENENPVPLKVSLLSALAAAPKVKPAPSIFHGSKGVPMPTAHKKDIFDECRLVDHEPWDDELRSILDITFDPLKSCNRSFTRLTQLVEGVLDQTFGAMLEGGYACEGRCLRSKTDYNFTAGSWEPLPMMVDCDVAETRCHRKGETAIIYNYLHTQVVPIKRPSIRRQKNDNLKPNVYIVLFDSVADTQSIRSFPKTVDFLQKRFNATRFRHLNKVGDNSRPNGFAFILGEVAYSINKDIFGVPSLKGTRSYEESCKQPLNKDGDFTFTRFRKHGYRTMIAEDWDQGVFNYPSCTGFNEQPVDHYMRPFQLRLAEAGPKSLLGKATGLDSCREPHLDLMEYFDKFVRAYPDDSKFGFIWMSYLTHDNPNMIFHADGDVVKFFQRNQEEFDESFVFFMGDHGLRFGKQRESKLGRVEVNNPMLHMIVPKVIREKFAERLAINSKEFITMFDLHSTFVDIVEYQSMSNFAGHDYISIPSPVQGSSLLRRLNPALPRNCRTLPVPFDYCPCAFDVQAVENKSTRKAMAAFVADLMNKELKQLQLDAACSKLDVDGEPDVTAFAPVNETHLYRVEFVATPGGGRFESLVRTSRPEDPSSYTLASPYFNRLNAYGKAAECITRAPQKPFCYCKKFLADKKHKG